MKLHGVLILSLFALSAAPAGAAPGDVMEQVYSEINEGVTACGLHLVSGQDSRLPYEIRARNVDQVIVKQQADQSIVPGVLIDRFNDPAFRVLRLYYAKTNGSHLFDVERTFDSNDVAITTVSHGRVAYTSTYFLNQELVTDYYLNYGYGAVKAQPQEFANYVENQVIKGFVKFVCGQAIR